jgi:RNA polymerase sigma-70 factor (ECF subfamily)
MALRGTAPSRPHAPVSRISAVTEASDESLVRRIAAREPFAEEVLFTRYVDYVWALSFRLLGDGGEADDVVQDTFIDALGQLRDLREPSSLRSWLAGIAVHKAHRVFRRRRLLALFRLRRSPTYGALEASAFDAAPQEIRHQLALADVALQGVKQWERSAWLLRYVDGYSLEEVADLCDCSLATAKRRIRVASIRVRRFLDVEGVDDE